jgi:type IV secretory pathway VirB3-like protein
MVLFHNSAVSNKQIAIAELFKAITRPSFLFQVATRYLRQGIGKTQDT